MATEANFDAFNFPFNFSSAFVRRKVEPTELGFTLGHSKLLNLKFSAQQGRRTSCSDEDISAITYTDFMSPV